MRKYNACTSEFKDQMDPGETSKKRGRGDEDDHQDDVQKRLEHMVAEHQHRLEQLEKSLQIATGQFFRRLLDTSASPAQATTLPQLRAHGGEHEPSSAPEDLIDSSPTVSSSVRLALQPHETHKKLNDAFGPLESSSKLDDAFGQLESSSKWEALSQVEDDDDFLIRYIFHGWDAATFGHRPDTAWQFLVMFDQHLYGTMENVDRLAALRALRYMLIHKIQPVNQAIRRIPPFFAPTALQQKHKHCSLADYFAWPSIRDYYIRNQDALRSAPQSAHTVFAMHFHFDWPYDLQDTYTTLKASGRLGFSKEFDERFDRLSSWKIDYHHDASIVPFHLRADVHTYSPISAPRLSIEDDVLEHDQPQSHADPGPSTQPLTFVTIPNNEALPNLTSPELAALLPHDLDESFDATFAGWDVDITQGMTQAPPDRQQPADEWAWAHETIGAVLDMALPM